MYENKVGKMLMFCSKFWVPSANIGMDLTESANFTAHLLKRDGTPRQWGEVRAVVDLPNYSSWEVTVQLFGHNFDS